MLRIRTVDVTATGRESVREHELAKAELSIGPAAENDIHLPDLAVEQRHVEGAPATDGKLRLKAAGTLGFTLDGRSKLSRSPLSMMSPLSTTISDRLELSRPCAIKLSAKGVWRLLPSCPHPRR